MKRDPQASRGTCLIDAITTKQQADDLLRDYAITTRDGGVQRITKQDRPATADEIAAIKAAKDGKVKGLVYRKVLKEKTEAKADVETESKTDSKKDEPIPSPKTAAGEAAAKSEKKSAGELDQVNQVQSKPKNEEKSSDKKDEKKSEPEKVEEIIVTDSIISYDIANPPRNLEQERMALAKGLAQITALNGGRFKPFKKTEIEFVDRLGHSEELGLAGGKVYKITMNRCDPTGKNCLPNNVAHLVHELGHQLGNSSNGQGEVYYQMYRRLVGGNCHPTDYSDDKFNEQFAENFAAFVTHPELLKNGDPVCQRAYAFFATDVFIHNGIYASCDKDSKAVVADRWLDAIKQTASRIANKTEDDDDELNEPKSKRKDNSTPTTASTQVRFKVIEAPPRPKFEDGLPTRKPLEMAEEINTRNQIRKDLEKKAKKGVVVTEAEVEAATQTKLAEVRKAREATAKAAIESRKAANDGAISELNKPMSKADQDKLVASVAKMLKSKPFEKGSKKSSNIKSSKKDKSASKKSSSSKSAQKSKAQNKSKSKSKARG